MKEKERERSHPLHILLEYSLLLLVIILNLFKFLIYKLNLIIDMYVEKKQYIEGLFYLCFQESTGGLVTYPQDKGRVL